MLNESFATILNIWFGYAFSSSVDLPSLCCCFLIDLVLPIPCSAASEAPVLMAFLPVLRYLMAIFIRRSFSPRSRSAMSIIELYRSFSDLSIFLVNFKSESIARELRPGTSLRQLVAFWPCSFELGACICCTSGALSFPACF